jgi:hypothetical protein
MSITASSEMIAHAVTDDSPFTTGYHPLELEGLGRERDRSSLQPGDKVYCILIIPAEGDRQLTTLTPVVGWLLGLYCLPLICRKM